MIGRDNQSARDAWIRTQLGRIHRGHALLDIGAGTQPYRDSCAHLQYLAVDSVLYPGIDMVMDLKHIKHLKNRFDAILCSEVIEHVPAPDDAIRDMAELLIPGGRIIITAPFACRTHMDRFFSSGFSPTWYKRIMADDFTDIEIVANGNRAAMLAQELWQLPKILWPIAWVCIFAAWLRWRNDLSTCFGYFVTGTRR